MLPLVSGGSSFGVLPKLLKERRYGNYGRGAAGVVNLTEGAKGIDTFSLRWYDRRPSEMRALFQRFPSIAEPRRGAGADMLQKRDERTETHLYLQTKYREVQEQFAKLRHHYVLELQEQFTTLRNRYYLIECAWCKKRIRWKLKEVSVPGDTSHGICPPCATEMLMKQPTANSTALQNAVHYQGDTEYFQTAPAA